MAHIAKQQNDGSGSPVPGANTSPTSSTAPSAPHEPDRYDKGPILMKAIGLTSFGGPEVLGLIELPDPVPGSGEVRVRVQASGLNPVDVMLRKGALASLNAHLGPPFVPGMDIAGIIDRVGPDIDPQFRIRLGQPVVGIVDNRGSRGGCSEYVVLPAASVTATPSAATIPQAASFLMNALTARSAIDALALPPRSTVLVTGAAGAVGGYAVALAHADGHRVIGVASTSDEHHVRELGADEFVPRGDGLLDRLREHAPAGVDAAIDAAALRDQIVPAIRDNGQLLNARSWDGQPDRGIRSVHVNVRDRVTDHAAIVHLSEHVEAGILPMRVAATYPAHAVVDAHRRLDQGGLRGRIILTWPELDR